MPRRLRDKLTFLLAGLVIAVPAPATAQRHGGGGWHGGGYGHGAYPRAYAGRYGGWHGHGGYRPYYGRGYAAYPRYYGYGGYPYGGYYHHHHGNDAWIAVGAGALGVMLGALMARPRYYAYPYQPYAQQPYAYPNQAPPAQAPATQQCPDGSTIPAGNYCPEPRVPRG